MDGCFPPCIAPKAHCQRKSWFQVKGCSKSDCQLSRCALFELQNTAPMLVSLNIPWLCTLLHIGYHLKVLSTKKTAKVLRWARSKLLFPKHIKGMFGENLKSAVTGNYIWIRHMRADAVWFLATEKNCRSRVQGRNAALGPASLVPWFPVDFLHVCC